MSIVIEIFVQELDHRHPDPPRGYLASCILDHDEFDEVDRPFAEIRPKLCGEPKRRRTAKEGYDQSREPLAPLEYA